jgi:transposase
MTDAEWAVIEPVLPAPAWLAGRGGRPAERCRRDVVDAVRYLVKEGITWRAMPIDLPPWPSVYYSVSTWQASGATRQMHDELRKQVRVAAGRNPDPSAAIVDSQSVRAAETVARDQRGYDAGKKINGRKRHIAVDTLGLLLVVLVTAASVQDRDGARALLWRLRVRFRRVSLVWADGGYAGKLVTWAAQTLRLTVQIVKRTDKLAGFVVLPRRWVVERTFSWITRYRRTVRDYERLPQHHETMVYWSMITLMGRRLARVQRPPAQCQGDERFRVASPTSPDGHAV